MRIKGMRNNHIRELLKKEIISVKDFCNLNDKELNDDNYFKNLENEQGNNNANNKTVTSDKKNIGDIPKTTKIVKPLNMPRNIPSIRPVIPKPIIPNIKIEKDLIEKVKKYSPKMKDLNENIAYYFSIIICYSGEEPTFLKEALKQIEI